ncbi:MAG: hypothetical protein MJ252_22800 [archaeon]|nr:hypothetical protein [archaeon]
MFRYYKAIKFENLVIVGGAVECLVLIICNITNLNFLIEFSESIQVMIIVYLIRRLFRIIQYRYLKSTLPLFQ